MAWDWIQGAQISPTCKDFELCLNNKSVALVPSRPQRLIGFPERGQDFKNCGLEPKIQIHFTRRDDFTPSEDFLDETPYGIDPISAKCIFHKLDEEERKHFFNLLMEPVIEDDHPEYLETLAFIQELPAERKKIIEDLKDLIADMGFAFKIKFKNSSLPLWADFLDIDDLDLLPFEKSLSSS